MPEIGLGHEASIRGQRSSKGLAFSQKPPKVLFLTRNLPTLLVPKHLPSNLALEPGTASRKMTFCRALRELPFGKRLPEFLMWKTGGNPVIPMD
jgi:hypothetical protein